MNLSANFIQPAEIRSASMVSIKSMLQMSLLLIPLVMAVVIAHAYVTYAEQKSTQELLEGTWANMEGRKNRVADLTADFKTLNAAMTEVAGWERSRLAWHELLDGIQRQVPATIQLKALQVRQTLGVSDKGIIERSYRMTLGGRCQGPMADARVEEMRRAFNQENPMGPLVKSALVTGFREDTEPGANEQDRAFQIEIDFNPRGFREAPAK